MKIQPIKFVALLGLAFFASGMFLFARSNGQEDKKSSFTAAMQDAVDEASNVDLAQMSLPQMETHFCAEKDFACRDLIFFWDKTVERDQIPALVNGAKDDFAAALRDNKRLSLRIRTGVIKQLEQRQLKRILGADYNIAALKKFLDEGNFTADGWGEALKQLCMATRQEKLEVAQVKDLKKWVKKIDAAVEKKTLPVIRLNNVDPFTPGNSIVNGCRCISNL